MGIDGKDKADEPIIIDGVDVAGCRLYLYRDKQPQDSRSCGEGLVDCNGKDCLYKQLQRAKKEKENLERKIKRLEEKTFTEESCPHCDKTVELPPYTGIYECPECGELIVCCSICYWDNVSCNSCKYRLLTEGYEKLTEELTALKQDYKACEKEYKRVVKENKVLKIKLFT